MTPRNDGDLSAPDPLIPPRAFSKAFTLVELLVVFTIVAILAAILLPVFVQAKESAKRAVCISNLKQCSMAALLYCEDYDSRFPQFDLYTQNGVTYYVYWYGAQGYTPSSMLELDLKKGLIQPYMKNTEIVDCPSAYELPAMYFFPASTLPFAYATTTSVTLHYNLSRAEMPAETILFGDAASFSFNPSRTGWIVQRSGIQHISASYYQLNMLHGRHFGSASIGWVDGHASTRKLAYVPFNHGNVVQATSAYLAYHTLGYLYKYPPLTATYPNTWLNCDGASNPNTFTASCLDFYYYLFVKPTR